MTDDLLPFDKRRQTARPWSCKAGNEGCSRTKPCRSCLGRRSRRAGQVKQRAAAKALGVPPSKFASQRGHEENYLGNLRTETKSGKQVQTVWKAYLKTENQNERARPIGDNRPFVATFMPDGVSDGLFLGRISKAREIAHALLEQLEGA